MKRSTGFRLCLVSAATLIVMATGCASTTLPQAADWGADAAPAPFPQGDGAYSTPESSASRGPWDEAHPRGTFFGAIGFGDLSVSPGGLPDETTQLFRLFFESAATVGGGFDFQFIFPTEFSVGAFPVTEVSVYDIFPFVMIHVKGGDRFRMPIRIGPYIRFTEASDEVGGDGDLTVFIYGLRLGVEPEFHIYQNDTISLGVFLSLLYGFGFAGEIEDDVDDADVDGDSLTFEFGVRFNATKFHAALAYVLREWNTDRSDPSNANPAVTFNPTEVEFDGFMLMIGLRW